MIEEHFEFATTDGLRLEAGLAYAEDLALPRARVLLCPPHPFLGGDMENNVLTGLCNGLAAAEFLVLRFNYRGIGRSETDRDLKQDEQLFWRDSSCPDYEYKMHEDALAAKQWFLARETGTPFYIVGYSYGCLPALHLSATDDRIERCALIAPPLTKWSIDSELLEQAKPKGVFYAPGDFACPADKVESLYKRMAEPKDLFRIEGGEHFFVGNEATLAGQVADFLTPRQGERCCA